MSQPQIRAISLEDMQLISANHMVHGKIFFQKWFNHLLIGGNYIYLSEGNKISEYFGITEILGFQDKIPA